MKTADLYFPVYVLLIGLVLIIAGVIGNEAIFDCEYMAVNILQWETIAAYGGKNFAGFLFGSYCFPIGLLLVLQFGVHGTKAAYDFRLKVALSASMFLTSIILCGFAYNQGKEVLDCGILFCTGDYTGIAFLK